MIRKILIVACILFGCFETKLTSLDTRCYPNRNGVLELAIHEISKVSVYFKAPIPAAALQINNFDTHFLGMDGIWMRWLFNFHYYDQATDLYYYGNVLVEIPPASAEIDAVCAPQLHIEPITEEDKSLLKLIDYEKLFSNRDIDTWGYEDRICFYNKYGTIRDVHTSIGESKPVYPRDSDPSYHEALIAIIQYYIHHQVNQLLKMGGSSNECICSNVNIFNIVIGSGFYERSNGQRFWVFRLFKLFNVGGQNELLELHAFKYENGKVTLTI